MKLLIIEDNADVARVTRGLLFGLEMDMPPCEHRIRVIDIVADLVTASRLLIEYDLVLCDGNFLAMPGAVQPDEYWATVAKRARDLWIPCVVYSGNPGIIARAQRSGVAAIEKPARAEMIYAVLMAVHDALGTLRPKFEPQISRRTPIKPAENSTLFGSDFSRPVKSA